MQVRRLSRRFCNLVLKFDFCRNCQAVSCVDCSVTFYGNDYEQHISCVSEDQKHHGSLYKAKKVKLNPQDAWVALIEDVTSRVKEAPPLIQNHLTRLGELNNVPRNKGKFINFCKNSLKLYNDNILEGLWAHLESCKKATEAANVAESTTASTNSKPDATAPSSDVATAVETEPSSSDKKEKKAKKDKKEKKEKSADSIANEETAVTEAIAEVSAEDKSEKKKSKKHKRDTEPVAEEVAEADESEKKKSKKSKKSKAEHDN